MKKFVTGVLTCFLALGLTACGGNKNVSEPEKTAETKRLSVVSTVFAQYDWVKEVLGKNPAGIETTLLINKGADLHSYQPSVEDIAKVKDADMFLYVGGESDVWVMGALEGGKANKKVLNLVEILGEKAHTEEMKEGMQEAEHNHDHEENHEHKDDHDHEEHHDHDHDHEHHHEHGEAEIDEHVWLSLRNAQMYVAKIAENLAEIDPENKDMYVQNATSYIAKLADLDKNMMEISEKAEGKTLLFGDRFPFRYFVEDYRLDYYAAFVGCSAETEASFETIAFLAHKVDELGLKNIFVIENSDKKIAEAVKENSSTKNQAILTLNSLQSVTQEEADKGASYLGLMEQNVEVLRQALVK